MLLVDDLVPRPSLRRKTVFILGSGLVLAAIGFVLVVAPSDAFHDRRFTGTIEGEVRPLDGPLGLRTEAAVTPIDGGRVFAWGGREGCWCRDGAIFDPATDSWQMLPAAPEEGRFGAGAAWTGAEVVVWGGSTAGAAAFDFRRDGLAYRPATNTWRTIPPAPFGLMSPRMVALPGGVLVTGGGRQQTPSDVRSLWFDLADETWTELVVPIDVLSLTNADGVVLGAGPLVADEPAVGSGSDPGAGGDPASTSVRGARPWAVGRFDSTTQTWELATGPRDADWMTAVEVDGEVRAVTRAALNEPLLAIAWREGAWVEDQRTALGSDVLITIEPTSYGPFGLWTGDQIVIGGNGAAAYDPRAKVFSVRKAAGLHSFGAGAVWTGSHIVSIGGQHQQGWTLLPS